MKTLKNYSVFNQRRYSNPWVAIIDNKTAKIDFSQKVGGYTGRYNAGEAGDLYITSPIEGAVYAYGQKDYRGNKTEVSYVKYINNTFVDIPKTQLIDNLK